jgi:hypothetical protein
MTGTMKRNTGNANGVRDDQWLRRESPEVYHMLYAVEGDDGALEWLRARSAALYLFTRAVTGDRRAAVAMEPEHGVDLEDLFGLMCHDGLLHWLGDRHPELHLLFSAICGDETALRRLRRKKAALAHLAEGVRDRYRAYQQAPPPEDPPADAVGITPDAAADVGCLIGELHLGRGDYHKAVEAFSRSLEGGATADAHEGRARAYRALAERDERQAEELRRRDVARV